MTDDKPLEALFRLMYAVKVQFAAELGAGDLAIAPMHVKVLKMVASRRACTAQDIATSFRRDKAQIARLIQDLSTEALIVRVPNPADKRSHLIKLSDEGRQVLRKTKLIDKRVIKAMLLGVNDADQAQFIALARRYADNLESHSER